MEPRSQTVRDLNDTFRRRPNFGSVFITPGVRSLGTEFIIEAFKRVVTFDDFNPLNDPHGEHDFGAFEIEGANLFFKIDSYDVDLKYHSPDSTDPSVTRRILTIMLAEEY